MVLLDAVSLCSSHLAEALNSAPRHFKEQQLLSLLRCLSILSKAQKKRTEADRGVTPAGLCSLANAVERVFLVHPILMASLLP